MLTDDTSSATPRTRASRRSSMLDRHAQRVLFARRQRRAGRRAGLRRRSASLAAATAAAIASAVVSETARRRWLVRTRVRARSGAGPARWSGRLDDCLRTLRHGVGGAAAVRCGVRAGARSRRVPPAGSSASVTISVAASSGAVGASSSGPARPPVGLGAASSVTSGARSASAGGGGAARARRAVRPAAPGRPRPAPHRARAVSRAWPAACPPLRPPGLAGRAVSAGTGRARGVRGRRLRRDLRRRLRPLAPLRGGTGSGSGSGGAAGRTTACGRLVGTASAARELLGRDHAAPPPPATRRQVAIERTAETGSAGSGRRVPRPK